MTHECPGDHEHHEERVYLPLTPSGLRLNVLSLLGELFGMLQEEDYEAAVELVDLAGQMVSAAYVGKFELLDNSYETAIVERFSQELDDPEVLTTLTEEGQ